MPQISRGGKYIFGLSLIRADGSVMLPEGAVNEYGIASEGRVYLFTGSKSTGGFCVTRRGLLEPSKLCNILTDNPKLKDYALGNGEFVRYKGRSYCWTKIEGNGRIILTQSMLECLSLNTGMKLFAVRSSNIAFTMGAKGLLYERVESYRGEITAY